MWRGFPVTSQPDKEGWAESAGRYGTPYPGPPRPLNRQPPSPRIRCSRQAQSSQSQVRKFPSGYMEQAPAGEHHVAYDSTTRPNRLHTHTHSPKRLAHPRSPMPPLSTLTARATHAHPLLTAALASVPYGLVLVRVRVVPPLLPALAALQLPSRRCALPL